MKIYIAASAADMPRVHAAGAAAGEAGFEVVCTWPTVVANTPGGSNPINATAMQRCGWSSQDLAEVAAADVLWFLVPHPPVTTRGAWVEAGYAHALGKHLVFSGPSTSQSIFCALGEEFDDDASALVHLKLISGQPQLGVAVQWGRR